MGSFIGASSAGTPSESPGMLIGRYKLLQQIGEGGFGSIWMAEQREPVKRRVAMKIIKLGMDTKQVIARFEAERQALALMEHPNIARVLDAGSAASGRPYFVMELVRGVPILSYCNTERVDTPGRLELFIQVCNAIQHAHHKGIIHRDVKPSNVLVTMHDGVPTPKVIDFGIAKATNAELTEHTLFTEHRQIIGTPAYMSPEQAEMSALDIDTRTDIYALGVLLYELLTGVTPFDARDLMRVGYVEMMRTIREQEPPRPSTRVRALGDSAVRNARDRRADPKKLGMILRGDLDWIILKCLEKDRTRRYDTAHALATDVRRYLDGKAVVAAPPSAAYRLRKFVRRNRGSVLTGAMVIVLLAVGAAGTTTGLVTAVRANRVLAATLAEAEAQRALAEANERRASEEAARAEQEAERARLAEADAAKRAVESEQMLGFLISQYSAIDLDELGRELRSDLLSDAHAAMERTGDPEAEVAARLAGFEAVLASVNPTNFAVRTRDRIIFERAIRSLDEQLKDQPLARARLLETLASALFDLGQYERAAGPRAEALRIRRELLGDDHPDTLLSINNTGLLLRVQGHYDEAERYILEALEGNRRVFGEDHQKTLVTMGNYGALLRNKGKNEEAEDVWRRTLEAQRRALGNYHADTLITLNSLGLLLTQIPGRVDEGEAHLRESVNGHRALYGAAHVNTQAANNNLGALLLRKGRAAEAVPFFQEALEGMQRSLGDEHPNTLTMMNNVGAVLRDLGRFSEAEALWRTSLTLRRKALGDDHPDTLRSLSNMCWVLRDLGALEESERFGAEAVLRGKSVHGSAYFDVGVFLLQHGRTLAALRRYPDAERELLEGHAIILDQRGPRFGRTRDAATALAELYEAWDATDPNNGYAQRAAQWRAAAAPPQ